MIISALVFTYFFKEIVEIIFLATAQAYQQANDLATINNFLRHQRVPTALAQKVKAYLETNWREDRFRNRHTELKLINRLPDNVKQDLYFWLMGSFLVEIGLVASRATLSSPEAKTPFLYHLCCAVEFERVTAGQVLYQERESIEVHPYLYFSDTSLVRPVTLGQRTISDRLFRADPSQANTEEKLNALHSPAFVISHRSGLFGEVEFFTGHPRNHWAVTNCNLEILKLHRSHFHALLGEHAREQEKEKVCLVR